MMMPDCRCSPGQAGEVRQARQRHVHAEGARARLERADAAQEIRGQFRGCDQALVQQLRPDVGDDGVGHHLLAALQPDADRAAGVDQHARHRRLEADRHAHALHDRRHRLRDRAHAAHGVAPRALPAVHLAEDVVQQHVGRPGRVGARVVADHGVEAEGGLDRLALEPAVEEGARGFREQVEHVALALERQFRHAPTLQRGRHQRPQPLARVRRRLQRERAQHVGHGIERRMVRGQDRGVVRREAAEFRLRALEPSAELQIAAVGLRQEVRDRPLDHPVAVIGELHVGDDPRVQQADGVARHRVAEAGMELLRDRRPADHRAALEDAHPESGPREVEGAHQPVVSAADDHRIVPALHRPSPCL